jgi:hypothetical protein
MGKSYDLNRVVGLLGWYAIKPTSIDSPTNTSKFHPKLGISIISNPTISHGRKYLWIILVPLDSPSRELESPLL